MNVIGRITMTAFDDDWLHMARLKKEQSKLKPGDPRYEEIEMIFQTMESRYLVEEDLD